MLAAHVISIFRNAIVTSHKISATFPRGAVAYLTGLRRFKTQKQHVVELFRERGLELHPSVMAEYQECTTCMWNDHFVHVERQLLVYF